MAFPWGPASRGYFAKNPETGWTYRSMTPGHLVPVVDSATEAHFEFIVATLRAQPWCVIPDALPAALAEALAARLHDATPAQFTAAGIGRQQEHMLAPAIRSDAIHWIAGSSPAEQAWLQWCDALRLFLNRRLFMGLESFESHFAHYAPGAFYKKHRDAFRNAPGQDASKRVVSVVAYFNSDWSSEDGGELLLYDEAGEQPVQRVVPVHGTLVVFLSEDVPHEVCVARRDRFSIAGWYRVRASSP